MAKHDPIKVEFQETQILDVRSVITTRDVINAKATIEDGNNIQISFDFLDQNDGIALEVFHDGGPTTKITHGGTVKGVREGINVKTREGYIMYSGPKSPDLFLIAGGIIFLILGIIASILILIGGKLDYIAVIFATSSGSLGTILLIVGIYTALHGRIPRQLDIDYAIEESTDIELEPQNPG